MAGRSNTHQTESNTFIMQLENRTVIYMLSNDSLWPHKSIKVKQSIWRDYIYGSSGGYIRMEILQSNNKI